MNAKLRVFVTLLLSILLIAYVFPWSNFNIKMPFASSPYKLGLDLNG